MGIVARGVLCGLLCATGLGGAGVAFAADPAAAAPGPRPTTAKGWYEKGSLHHKLGEFELAVEAYKEAFRLDRGSAVHLYNIGLAYGQAGKWAEAVRYYELYLEEDPVTPLRPEIEAQIARMRVLALEASAPSTSPVAPESAIATAPRTLPPLVVHSTPVVPPGYESGRRRGLAIGLGVGAAALVVAGAITAVVLVLRGSAVDRYLGDYGGRIIDLRPE